MVLLRPAAAVNSENVSQGGSVAGVSLNTHSTARVGTSLLSEEHSAHMRTTLFCQV